MLDGSIRALQRKQFDETARLSVKFSDDGGYSEGAVDAGGPTREFLRLVLQRIVNSSIFFGDQNLKYITKSEIGM